MAQASLLMDVASTCLICFETRPLKIVGNCNHSFCDECLSNVFGNLESGSEVFACPSCKVECPRPSDGVLGLVSFTGEDANGETVNEPETLSICEGNKQEPDDETNIAVIAKCQICLHRKTDVRAVNLCIECGHLYICAGCTEVHASRKATKEHAVIPLKYERKKKESLCESHDSVLNSYCQDCKTAVCMICVMLEHGEHTVEKLKDTIRSKADKVTITLNSRKEELRSLHYRKNELTLLENTTPLRDKKCALIKDIEDHAQKCIDQIVKSKETLKKEVEGDFQIIEDFPVGLAEVSRTIQKMQDPINRANKLLATTEHHPDYLGRLVTMEQDLQAIAVDDVEMKDYTNRLGEIHWNSQTFTPEAVPESIGKVSKESNRDTFKHQEVFEHTMQAVSKDMFIPCVANLGKLFAVAHPTKPGQPSQAIDIYEFPGTLRRTLKDHVPPVHDISATSDSKLAVLSSRTRKLTTKAVVKVFDPEAGHMSSTCDIDIKPLSLGVTLDNQYIILGNNISGQRQIIIVDTDGVVERNFSIRSPGFTIENAKRITCSRSYIFVCGDRTTTAIKVNKDADIKVAENCSALCRTPNVAFADISATVWDDLFLTYIYTDAIFIERFQDKENKLRWTRGPLSQNYDVLAFHLSASAADREARLSTRDGHIVLAHGQTIKVSKIL